MKSLSPIYCPECKKRLGFVDERSIAIPDITGAFVHYVPPTMKARGFTAQSRMTIECSCGAFKVWNFRRDDKMAA